MLSKAHNKHLIRFKAGGGRAGGGGGKAEEDLGLYGVFLSVAEDKKREKTTRRQMGTEPQDKTHPENQPS